MNRFIVTLCCLTVLSACKKHTDNSNLPGITSTPHQWQPISSPVTGYNSDIYFTARDTGYIFGYSGSPYILRSADAGATWQLLINFGHNVPVFNCFYPLAANVLFAARDSLYTSVDGGATWHKNNAWNGTTASKVTFVNRKTGFILTNDKIYSSRNGGNSWCLQASLSGGYNTLVFPDSLHGFASGGAPVEENASKNIASIGVLSRTIDGGNHWTRLDTGSWLPKTQRFQQIYAIDFSDNNHGLIALNDGTLEGTSDGGVHWQLVSKILPGALTQLKYDKTGKVYFICSNKVFSSDDNGKTIGLEFTGPDDFMKITVTTDNQIFLVGRSAQIYKRM